MGTRPLGVVAVLAVLAVLAVWAVWAVWALRRDSRAAKTARTARTEGLDLLMYGDVGVNDEPLPFYVQLINAEYGEPVCGGVLIGPDVVLTAAHCLADISFARYYCSIGDDSIIPAGEPGNSIEYRFIRNVKLYGDTNRNDIALVYLDKPVKARPVDLWKTPIVDAIDLRDIKMVGRGWTEPSVPGVREYRPVGGYKISVKDLVIQQVGDVTHWTDNTFIGDGLQKLIHPFELLTYKKPPIAIERSPENDDQLKITLPEGNILQGDSGSPLLVKNQNRWYVAGVTSHLNTYEDGPPLTVDASWNYKNGVVYYESVAGSLDWIQSNLPKVSESKSEKDLKKLDKESVTVHEIAHVVALTRLKHLKTIAATNNTTFDKLFLTAFGKNKKKQWLNLADYFNENANAAGAPWDSRYPKLNGLRATDSGRDAATKQVLLAKKQEVQLAVLWALVSSYDSYHVLLEMVSEGDASESTGIPYFLRLGYSWTADTLTSLGRQDQSFVKKYIGADAAWTIRGRPSYWTTQKTEKDGKELVYDASGSLTKATYEANHAEKAKEGEHIGRRDQALTYLDERPLRRRMYCDFMETLREYLKARPVWYKKYLQYNNITSPTRTYGLLECYAWDPSLYVNSEIIDGEFIDKPYTSYSGPLAQTKCPKGSYSFPFHRNQDSVSFLLSFIKTRMKIQPTEFQTDPSRAWLQATGDYWPELTSTTLYDRYEWIEMPKQEDARTKITFREAMFLVTEEEMIDVPEGIKGADAITPSEDDGSWKKTRGFGHPGTNNIYRYRCPMLLYFYMTAGIATDQGRAMAADFMKKEKTRLVFKTMEDWNPYDVNDDVIVVHDKNTGNSRIFREKIVTFLGAYFQGSFKNDRKLGTNHAELKEIARLKYVADVVGKLNSEDTELYSKLQKDFKAFLDSGKDLQPEKPFYVEYELEDGSESTTVELQPLGKKLNERFLAALPECAPKTAKTPAPADNKKKPPPQDEARGGGGQQELDALLAEIWDCI